MYTFESGRVEQDSHGNRSGRSGGRNQSQGGEEEESGNQAASVRAEVFLFVSDLSCYGNRRKSQMQVLR